MHTPTGRLTFLIAEYGSDLPKKKWGDLSQHTLETLAVESYQMGWLSRAQLRP